jgi:ABC-type enterochelin transport system permease subunit
MVLIVLSADISGRDSSVKTWGVDSHLKKPIVYYMAFIAWICLVSGFVILADVLTGRIVLGLALFILGGYLFVKWGDRDDKPF